ncbi:MAG: SAM-dependent methyltransferase [Hyphomonadaceae bacterium]
MSLKDRLIRQIRMDGPMPVSSYMQTCLHDPKDGYYANGAGLGRDFITAPETSQMFGELIGLWLVNAWQATGASTTFNIVEMGGGRGTLMADAMRAAHAAADTNFANGLFLELIEASPALRDLQAKKLEPFAPSFKDRLEHVNPHLTFIIANEFLDCLPARQFVREDEVWRERVVGLDEDGELAFGIDRSDLRAEAAADMPPVSLNGETEVQPGLDGLIETLSDRVENGDRFHALFIDYGPDNHAPTDTLRAYKNGEQVDPLACPGEADLTVDVDFGRLAKLAKGAGLSVSGPITQGEFLGKLGLQERLDTLIKANPERAEALFQGAQKLVDPAEMGTRFKVICISTPSLPKPAGFE